MDRPAGAKIIKIIGVLCLYGLLIFGGTYIGDLLNKSLNIENWPHSQAMLNGIVIIVLVAYVVLTALPFLPGVELGLGLIMVFGLDIVPVVYVSTVLSLSLSFMVGRRVPHRWLSGAFKWLGLGNAARLTEELAALSVHQRIAYLTHNAPKTWIPWLIRHRLIALAILFNLPGSALLGGGGGIAMAAGMSRLVTTPKFLLCVAIGVSPVPLILLAGGLLGHGMLK